MSVETKSRLAVALHYDKTGAPLVVAKGKGVIGAKIIELAREHDIPIEENEVATKSRRISTRRSPKCWSSCCGFRAGSANGVFKGTPAPDLIRGGFRFA